LESALDLILVLNLDFIDIGYLCDQIKNQSTINRAWRLPKLISESVQKMS